MEPLSSILGKKFSRPQFKQAIVFTQIKEAIEEFFLMQGLRIRVIAFDQKEKHITLTTSHPAHSRDALTYHNDLNAALKEKGMPWVKKISITASR